MITTNTKTLLTIKIDKKLKEQAKLTAAEFGLPLGTMVNSLIRRTVNEGRLELIAVKPTALRRINRIRKELREGKGHGPFTVDQLIEELER
jgi:antitoxin component of RelBE/YafQ-DinJ toxin-antitoxin module